MKITMLCPECGFMKNMDFSNQVIGWIDKKEIDTYCGSFECKREQRKVVMEHVSFRELKSCCEQGNTKDFN